MSDRIEWQLPIVDTITGKGDCIHWNTKIHCYVNGYALCTHRYWMVPGCFETTEYGEKDIDIHPEYFCKKCVKKFKKMKGRKKEEIEHQISVHKFDKY